MAKSMGPIVKLIKSLSDILCLREDLLNLYMKAEDFREALSNCESFDSNKASYGLEDVKEEAANVFIWKDDFCRYL